MTGGGAGQRTERIEQIRNLAGDLMEVADVVAERRQAHAQAGMALAEAEARYTDVSARMAELLARHKAAGDPNAPKHLLNR